MILNIFSCASWPSVCLPQRKACLDLPPIFLIRVFFFFFFIELHVLSAYFADLSLVSHFICKYFLSFCGFSFCSADGFLCCAKAFNLNLVPFVDFFKKFSLLSEVDQNRSFCSYVRECWKLIFTGHQTGTKLYAMLCVFLSCELNDSVC